MKKIKSLFQWIFKSRVRILVTIIILIAAGYLVWKNFFNKTSTPQYQTAQVEKGTIISTVSASGAAISANIMPVTTGSGGLITNVYVKDGDKVTKGQKIAEVMQDSNSAQQSSQAYNSYLSAKNSLFSANNNFYSLDSQMWAANQKFQNDAVTRGLATTDPTYIQENDNWLAAEAAQINQGKIVAQAQASVNNAWISYQASSPIITAPISGVIDNISISEGMNLASVTSSSTGTSGSTKVAVVRVNGNPLVTMNVSEIDISKVKIGQKATITFDSLSGKTYTGKVVSVDKVGTVTSGVTSYPVTIKLDTDSSEILPNMSSSADIIIATKDSVLMVPSAAVQTQNGQDVVRVLKGSQVQNINVVIGLISDTQTEIVSGLSEGQTVITGSVAAAATQGGSSIFSRSFGGSSARVVTGGGR
jgi:multidrug efflux pump subunit AcrA (membrane-fusion protein)